VLQADPVEPLDEERTRSDEEVRAELQAVLDRIPEFSAIHVSVEAGVVRLQGTVLDPEAANQAKELVGSFDGVRFVIDAITENTSLQERLRPVWNRLREFGVGFLATLPLLLVAFLIVLASWFVGRFLRNLRLIPLLGARNPFLQNLIQSLVQAVAVFAGILIALDLLGATALVGAVAGTAGLAGLAIGFAFKDIVENYLAGILLGVRQPFAKNDHVVVADQEGKVVRLTWRDTILMTLDGNHVRVPNGRVFGSTVLNYTRNPKRRFEIDFGVGPADDLARAQDLGIRALETMRSVLDDPAPRAIAVNLGDSSVLVRFWGWVDQSSSDILSVRSEAIRLVKMALEDAGITLPSPEYQVRLLRGESQPDAAELAPASGSAVAAAEERDTSVDRTLDEQILEDRQASGEEDLLGNDDLESPSSGAP